MRQVSVLAAMFGLFLIGCGGGGPINVKGTLHFEDGKPVGGAALLFHPKSEGGKMANGFTLADGSFTLSTGSGEGVLPGDYVVAVTKAAPVDSSGLETPGKEKRKPIVDPVPAIYGTPTSPLTAKIESGTTKLELKIKR